MFHKMNNQFQVLRLKNGTTTTVIKVIADFTTVNSTTNDEMDCEFTVTNSFTKIVKRKTKWGFPDIIKTKKNKKSCFRCGIVGHRVNKCIFLFARRPVVMVTVTTATVIPPTTTTTIPKTTIEKIHSESEKKIPNQNRGQKLNFFHGNLKQRWVEFQKKMDVPPFVLSVLINRIKFVNALCDIGCLFHGFIESKFVTKCGLKRMEIIF